MASQKNIATIRLRGILTKVADKLSAEETEKLGFIYLGEEIDQNALGLMRSMMKGVLISNSQEHLYLLMESLESIGRTDMKQVVEEYILKATLLESSMAKSEPPGADPLPRLDLNDVTSTSGASGVTGVHLATEEDKSDNTKSTISGLGIG